MDQFHEAQERFRRGSLFDRHAYTRDMLMNYGNGGRKMELPQMSRYDYEKALAFRNAEKERYRDLERQLVSVTAQLRQSNMDCEKLAAFINAKERRREERKRQHILKSEQDTSDASAPGNGDSHAVGSGGNRALPPARDSSKADTDAGQSEAIISSTSVTNELADTRRHRARRNVVEPDQQNSNTSGENRSSGPVEAGRSSVEATDGSESNVGGPADQHEPKE